SRTLPTCSDHPSPPGARSPGAHTQPRRTAMTTTTARYQPGANVLADTGIDGHWSGTVAEVHHTHPNYDCPCDYDPATNDFAWPSNCPGPWYVVLIADPT